MPVPRGSHLAAVPKGITIPEDSRFWRLARRVIVTIHK
jgi:hypothetical protein